MKYISVIVMVLLMIWTWALATSHPAMNLQQHKQVEESFEDFIRASILQKHPEVSDVIFRQLFTETLKAGEKVRARFRYEIVSPTSNTQDLTSQTVEGSAVLTSRDHGGTWTMSDVDVISPSIIYQNGSKITPKDSFSEAPEIEPSENHEKPESDAKPGRKTEAPQAPDEPAK